MKITSVEYKWTETPGVLDGVCVEIEANTHIATIIELGYFWWQKYCQ